MNNYRFKLEPYKGVRTRYTCPACERPRCFARYIDTEGRIEFPDNVGRCDHEQSCGYHCTPKDYFAKHPLAKEDLYSSDRLDYTKLSFALGQNAKQVLTLPPPSSETESFIGELGESIEDFAGSLFDSNAPAVDVAELIFQRKLRNQANKKPKRRRL